ncbi:MAG: hypothetical protein ACE5EO_01710 [Candidatus Krumholzibacteriia bacterium]
MLLFRRSTALLFFLAAGIATGARGVRAEEPVITNLQLMTILTDEVIEELLSRMPASIKSRPVILAPYTSDERYEFISNGFSRILTSNGYRTLKKPVPAAGGSGAGAPPAVGGIRLEYQALDFSLIYPKAYRAHLIGGRKVKRRANITLLAKLVEPGDEAVAWIGEASRSREDQFAHRLLPQVEADLLEFTKPEIPSTRWGRVVEPVVVSGIIVGLIYLFFSNQDNN